MRLECFLKVDNATELAAIIIVDVVAYCLFAKLFVIQVIG